MKTKEFFELEKRLLPQLPGFAIKGSLVFLSPVENTLRGFHFESSAFSDKRFYVNMFFLLLCVPMERVHFTFGHRLGTREGWSRQADDLEARLVREMQKEVPFLRSLRTAKGIARALEPLAKRLNPHSQEAFAYSLVQAGETTAALRALERLLKLLDRAVPWQEAIAVRAQLIQDKLQGSLEDARRQLRLWGDETVSNLGLEAFRPS